MLRTPEFQRKVLELAHFLSRNGFSVIGGVANQHYMQKAYHGELRDLDLVIQSDDIDEVNQRIRAFAPPLRRIADVGKKLRIYETTTEDGIPIHVELTTVPFKSTLVSLNHSIETQKKIIASVPDPNYLIARLIFVTGRPNVEWTRRLDSLAYLSHIISKTIYSKEKVMDYLSAILGGNANRREAIANFNQVIYKATVDEIITRTNERRTRESFDYTLALERLKNQFHSKKPSQNPIIEFSATIGRMTNRERQTYSEKLGVKGSDSAVFHELLDRLTMIGQSPPTTNIPNKVLQKIKEARETDVESARRKEAKVFITADHHFGHERLITHYKVRPEFKSVGEMNDEMVKRWNKTVGKDDIVYHVGDLVFRKHPDSWLDKLNGNIIIVKGNHDTVESNKVTYVDQLPMTVQGKRLLLIHNPSEAPSDFNGWVIHGHHHGNDIHLYPFVNHENKTVNASVELTNYEPVPLDHIIKKIKQAEKKKRPIEIYKRFTK